MKLPGLFNRIGGRRARCQLAALALVSPLLVAAATDSASADTPLDPSSAILPVCTAGDDTSTTEPTGLPGDRGVAMCQALPTTILTQGPPRLPVGPSAAQDPVPHAGYHHLGAQSSEQLAMVRPRLGVTNPAVRRSTIDFVASRVMAKEDYNGSTLWLEAGWAEVGWRNDDQYVYTYDTRDNQWKFYDQYNLSSGTRFFALIDSEVSSTRSTNWRAWIWWNNAWNRLSTISLPIYDEAFIEEYVEVYRDPNVTGHFNLPSTDIDNVQVKESPGSSTVYWRNPPISTLEGSSIAPYCLTWDVKYDDFRGASC